MEIVMAQVKAVHAAAKQPSDSRFTSMIISEGKFKTLLKDIQVKGKGFRETIQEACFQSLLYGYIHNDFDQASRLMLVANDELSRDDFKRVKQWFISFGPYAWRKTDDMTYPGGMKFRKDTSDKANPFDLEAALENPWFKVAMETDEDETEGEQLVAPVKFLNRIQRLVRDIVRTMDEEKLENPDENREDVEDIVEMLQTILTKHPIPEETEENPVMNRKAA